MGKEYKFEYAGANTPRTGTDLSARDLSWFASKVKQGEKGIFAEVVTITPDIAKRILEQNADNRPMSPKYINQITHDIKVGQFEINGETIIISVDGWLNDGQNRLMAIIQANQPVQCLVCFGVTRRSRMTVDMGRVRTVNHYLGMEGTVNAHFAGIVAAQWAAFELDYYGKLTKQTGIGITKQDTLKFYHDHKDMVQTAITKLKTALKNLGSQGSGVITAYCILQSKDPLYTDDFFNSLIEGVGLERDSIILTLRNRLIAGSKSLNPYNKAELVLRCWMAWKDGRKLRQIPLMNEWPKGLDDYGREPPAEYGKE